MATGATFERHDGEMKLSSERSAEGFAAALMDSKYITAREANEVLQRWESMSLRVCFAVCLGELAWHAQWVETIRNGRSGRWVLVAGQASVMLSTDQYKEIILTEDDDLLGLRFLQPVGAMPGFEVDLFIDKNDGLDEDTLPLLSRIIQ
jgi:hypothetical protein